MPHFVTLDELKVFSAQVENRQQYREARARSDRSFTTFLSHSSKDDEYLPGVIRVLESHGASVYIDDGDTRLPEKPSPDTARILKQRINESRRFVLFVTENSKGSKWIPWELGLGDGLKSAHSVALFPSAQYWWEQSWSEQEYLGLYQRIVWGRITGDLSDGWIVLNHHENSATHLRKWLER